MNSSAQSTQKPTVESVVEAAVIGTATPPSKLIQSMTGFASVNIETEAGTVAAELRSVNSRFLDLVFKLPDELRTLEPALRERLTGLIQRGKVECRISVTKSVAQDRPAVVNDGLLDQLLSAAGTIRAKAPEAAPLTLADLLRWPGVMRDGSQDSLIEPRLVLAAFDALALEFQASRAREGDKLALLLLDRLGLIERLIGELTPKVPTLLKLYSDKLTERLRAALLEAGAGGPISPEEMFARVRQEITVYALKIDVAEELGRLAAHASEMRRVLSAAGSVGKRLDFLMQEFNREANTLGSKGLDLEVSRASVELKILIEQMREQIQNLE